MNATVGDIAGNAALIRDGMLDAPLNILVPVTGTAVSRKGAELAIALAQGSRGRLAALYVAASAEGYAQNGLRGNRNAEQTQQVSRAAIDEIVALGKHYGVSVQGLIRRRETAQSAILREVRAGRFNLVVLGVSPRPGDQLFFGEVAADLLANAPCSLVFLTSEPIATAPRPADTQNDRSSHEDS